jgi:hypothetical protein
MLGRRMKAYEAPVGKVYDYALPRIITVINNEGVSEQKEEHLYVKYLFLGPKDSIDNYKIVDDPKENE